MRKKHVGLTVFLIILAVLLLPPAVVYGYLALSDYEEAIPLADIAAVAEKPYDGERTVASDDAVTVLLDADDVGWLVNEYGLLDEIAAYSQSIALESVGVSFFEGGFDIYAKGKLAGFLPLPVRVSAGADFAGGDLRLTVQDVMVGKRIHIAPEKLASYGVDEVIVVDAGEIGLDENGTREIQFLQEGVQVTRTKLGSLLSDVFPSTRPVAKTLSAYGETEMLSGNPLLLVAANYENVASGSKELMKSFVFADDPYACLVPYLAAGEPGRVQSLLDATEAFDRHFIVGVTEEELTAARGEMDARIAGKQATYEKWLTALREEYQSGKLTLAPAGLIDNDTGEALALSSPMGDEAESRALLLYSKDALHAVKTADMPLLKDVPHKSAAALQGMYDGIPYDIGILTRLPSGIAALLYYEATGDFIVQCMHDARYDAYMTARKQPFVFMDSDLPRPPTRALQAAPAATCSPYEVLLSPETMVAPAK